MQRSTDPTFALAMRLIVYCVCIAMTEEVVAGTTSHTSAEDMIREMTNLVDRFVQESKTQVAQLRRRDREFTLEQDSAL